MPTADDGRVAATLKTTLACAVIAASFAAIAVQAAVAVFVFDKRQHLLGFKFAAGASTLSLLLSAVLGAKGVSAVYKDGYNSIWGATTGKGLFSGQAGFGFLGMVLIVWSALCGQSKPEAATELTDYIALKAVVGKLQTTTAEIQKNLIADRIEIDSFKTHARDQDQAPTPLQDKKNKSPQTPNRRQATRENKPPR